MNTAVEREVQVSGRDNLSSLVLARQSLSPTYPEQIPFVRDFLGAARDWALSPIKSKIAEIAAKPYKPLFTDGGKGKVVLPSETDIVGVNSASQQRARNRRFEQVLGLTPYEPKPQGRTRVALVSAGAGVALFTACLSPQPTAESSPNKPTTVKPAKPDATPVPGVKGPADNPTAVASGGEGEANSNNIEQKIAKGQATPDEIREFNETVLERATLTTWITEKGEVRKLPQIEGLRPVGYAVNNELKTLYFAMEKNPYGLEVNSIAGIFHKEVFDVKDNENSNQVGSVGLRAEVLAKLLKDANSLSKAVFPIPADFSKAQGDRTVLVQESTLLEKQKAVFLTLPVASNFVVNLDNGNDSQISLRPMSTLGGSLTIKSPLLMNKFRLDMTYYGTFAVDNFTGKLGDKVLEIGPRPFSEEIARKGFAQFSPPPDVRSNVYLSAIQGTSNDGNFERLDITKKNLLRVNDNAFVHLIANGNSLLSSSK